MSSNSNHLFQEDLQDLSIVTHRITRVDERTYTVVFKVSYDGEDTLISETVTIENKKGKKAKQSAVVDAFKNIRSKVRMFVHEQKTDDRRIPIDFSLDVINELDNGA